MILYDFFNDGKPDSGAGVFFFIMQFLKYFENPFRKFRFEANPVIFDDKMAIFFVSGKFIVVKSTPLYNFTRNVDVRLDMGIRKFERIANKVKHKLAKLEADNICRAQIVGLYNGMFFIDGLFEIAFYFVFDNIEIGIDKYSFAGVDAREGKQIFDKRLHPFSVFLHSVKEFFAFIRQITAFARFDAIGESLYFAKWLLQIMARYVR